MRPQQAPDGSTTERLVDMLRARHAAGLAKYGTTVDREDLGARDWLQHAVEEALDMAAYLMRLREDIEAMEDRRDRALEKAKEAKP